MTLTVTGNVTFENAANLGGGKIAYFQNGSLQVVAQTIPEPSTIILVGLGPLALIARRRKNA